MATHNYDAWRAMREREEADRRVPLALAMSREALRLCVVLYRAGRKDLEGHVEGINRELLYRADVGRDLTQEEALQAHHAFDYAREEMAR